MTTSSSSNTTCADFELAELQQYYHLLLREAARRLGSCEAVVKRVEARLRKEPGVTEVSAWVGSGVPRFYLPLDQVFPQTNVSQLIVMPKDLKTREALRVKLPALLAEEFPEVRGRVTLLPNGRSLVRPPLYGAPLLAAVGFAVYEVRRSARVVLEEAEAETVSV